MQGRKSQNAQFRNVAGKQFCVVQSLLLGFNLVAGPQLTWSSLAESVRPARPGQSEATRDGRLEGGRDEKEEDEEQIGHPCRVTVDCGLGRDPQNAHCPV